MKRRDLDALILVCRDNIRLATGFRTSEQMEMGGSVGEQYAAVVDKDGGSYIFAPWYGETMEPVKERNNRIKEFVYIPAWVPAFVVSDFWAEKIGKRLEALKAKKIGFDYISSILSENLKQKIGGATFHPIGVDFLEARMVKHGEEIKLLETAAAVLDGATTVGLDMIKEGVTEYQIAGEIVKRMTEAGSEWVSHIDLVSGSRPFAELSPTNRVVRVGDAVTLDLGIYWKGGYTSDEARTEFVGKPPKAFMDAYRLLKETLFKTTKAMVPGRKASEIDLMLRKPLLEAGYTDSPYANGHGLGLRVMELPQIDKPEFMVKDYELKENMSVNIEPETTVGDYGMKLEHVVIVREDGGVPINNTRFLD